MKLPKIPYWPLLLGPYMLYALGYAMNALVCAVNHAAMPVLPGYIPAPAIGADSDTIHVAMTVHTHLKFLADWVVINGLGMGSPGDFLEWSLGYTQIPAAVAWVTLMLKDAQVKS
jgi:hypothetical protein